MKTEKGSVSLREAKDLADKLAEMIQRASVYRQEGIRLVTKMVARQLIEAGFTPPQLIQIASSILQTTNEYLHEINFKESAEAIRTLTQ